MDLGYDSDKSNYYSTCSHGSDLEEEEGALETTMFTALPRDVIEFHLWPILMEGCKLRSDMLETLCTLQSVCSAWRKWIRGTEEGIMYMQAFSNHLVDMYVQEEMEEIARMSSD